jgi:pyruvate/2-oxoglutarate dehydrogenase complex dihydrolipoamide acyltransferase (E2) component
MLCNRLPTFQPPPLDAVPHGRYAMFQTGRIATVTGVVTRLGRLVEWGEPLVEIMTDGAIEEIVTAPANGVIRWIHPHVGTLRKGSPVALLELDQPPPRLDTARVFIPHFAPLPPTPAPVVPTDELTLTTALLIPGRRSTMRLPFEIEEIKEEPLPFPYNLADKTKRRTFHLPEAGGAWADKEADRLNVNVSHLVHAMIYSFATLTPAQRSKVVRAWQKKWREVT